MSGIILSIEKDSIAEELGWLPGDEIVSINGHVLHDAIDFRFYSAEEFLTVLVRRSEEEAEFEIEKDADEPLGVEFKDVLFDGVRTCGASCVFCFVEQLPKGLRKSLYLKDDDFRLSFLHGNFITLANVSDEDLKRIVTQRLSPLYVSIHATEHALRERMIGRDVPDLLAQIDTLAKGRITIHAQIVLCRGLNDGDHLDCTVFDLAQRHPTVASIAIVPAAVTAHRRNKTPIGTIDPAYSAELLRDVKSWQRRFRREKGTRLIWAADEFYLNAGQRAPKAQSYEGYPQIENGVGLVRVFKDSGYRARRILPHRLQRPLMVSVVTGALAAPLLQDWAKSIATENLDIRVHEVRNQLFGESVTVAGLMSGRDIADQLRNREVGDALFVPSVALRDDTFLDDVTVEDLSSALDCRVVAVEPTPYQLARQVLELARSPFCPL